MADLTASLSYSRDEGPGKRPYIYSYQVHSTLYN